MRFSYRQKGLQPAASSALGHAVLGRYIQSRCQKGLPNYSAVMSHFFGFYGVPATQVEWQMWLKLDSMLQKVKADPAYGEKHPEELRWDRVCAETTDVLYARNEKAYWRIDEEGYKVQVIPYDRGEEKSFRRLFERACHEEGFSV